MTGVARAWVLLVCSSLAVACASHQSQGEGKYGDLLRNIPGIDEVAEPTPSYLNTGGHVLRDNTNRGRSLALDDGSLWEVIPPDRTISARWLIDAPVVVVWERPRDRRSHSTGYLLINGATSERVGARYQGSR